MIAFAERWFTISLKKICTACSVVESKRENRNWSQSIGCVRIDWEEACTYSLGVYSPITTLSADVDAHNCLDRISVIGHLTPMNAFGLKTDSAKYSGARKWLHASANCQNFALIFRNEFHVCTRELHEITFDLHNVTESFTLHPGCEWMP